MLFKLCSKNGGTVSVIMTALISAAILLFGIAVLSAARATADSEMSAALPAIHITADGRTISVQAQEENMTVGELLARADIVLGENDEVNVPVSAEIYDDMSISVSRVEYRTRERTTFIPYETEYTETPLLKIGDEEVQREGVNGLAAVFIRDKFVEVGQEIEESP